MSENVVKNGNFVLDADKNGLADAWNTSGRLQDMVSFDLLALQSGQNAQKIAVISPKAAKIGCYFGIASDPFDLPKAETIKVTACVKAENVVDCHMLVFLRNADSQPLSIPLIPSPAADIDDAHAWAPNQAYPAIPQTWRSGSWDWQTYSAVIPISPEVANAEIDFWFRYSGTLWVSNVTVTPFEGN